MKNGLGGLVVVLFACVGCTYTPLELEGRKCDAQGRCVEGYVCEEGFCVRPGDAENPCIPDPCNSHGSCSVTDQEVMCECELGWSGANCETENCPAGKCELPKTCRPLDGECVGPDPCDPDPCNGHGECASTTGSAVCTCVTGFSGLTCNTCDTGYDGYPTCEAVICFGVDCNDHGSCDPIDGLCECNPNWDQDTNCNSCVNGYQDYDGNGTCLAACTSGTCNSHGSCLDSSGTATCTCETGFDLAQNCGDCDTGYIEYPTCRDDPCDPDPCNGHGSCSQSDGSCTCNSNWDPATDCSTCLANHWGDECEIATRLTFTSSVIPQNLVNGNGITVYQVTVAAVGGNGTLGRLTWRLQFTGAGSATTAYGYRDGTYITSGASRVAIINIISGRVVMGFFTPDVILAGTSKTYLLALDTTGIVAGDTLTVSLLKDTTPPATMVGQTAFVYDATTDRLYTSATGLCSFAGPYIVWSGKSSITYPTVNQGTCAITANGSADFSDSSVDAFTWFASDRVLNTP